MLLALAAAAATYAAPLDLPKTAHIDMVVVKTREDIRGGKTKRNSGETRYDKMIEARGDGYRVTLKPTGTKLALADADADAAKAEAALGDLMTRTIVYTTDDSLAPSAIEDWPGMVAEIRKAMITLAAGDKDAAKTMDSVIAAFGAMSPKQAATVLLKEDGFLTIATNVELELGKPVTYEEMLPNPMGGAPIKSNGALVVQKVDPARGVATLRWTQTLDPDSMRASVAQMIEKMTAGMGAKADSPEAKAVFAKMSFDRSSACDYEVDLKSGLPTKADCESRIKLTDPSTGEVGGRNEYWVITQTLKN